MQQFVITLKNEKLRSYHRISFIIILIHGLIFLYLSLFSSDKTINIVSVSILVLLIALYWIKYSLGKKWKTDLHLFFLVLAIGWIGVYQYWLAFIPVVFDILYMIAIRKLVAVFSQEDIRYPSFPSRKITWDKLNNVMVKDGLLTIDFKRDKMIQQTVDETLTVLNEKEFNEFCRDQLRKSGPWKDEPGVWDALGYGLPDLPI